MTKYLTLGGAAALALLLAGCAEPPTRTVLTYAERPCYRTLAEVDCHPHALVNEESRRVGFYDTPIATEEVEAWPGPLF